MKALFSLAWLLLYSLSLSILLLPSAWWWHIAGPVTLSGITGFVFLLPVTLLAGWGLLMVLAAFYCRLLPATPSGTFNMFNDKGAVLWALNNALPTLYLKWFQSTLFLNEHLRYLMLRAFNASVPFSAWIPTNAAVSDLRNTFLGEGVVIGEYSKLVASFQPVPGVLVVGSIRIDDNVLVGGNSILLGDIEIGADSVLQGNVTIAHRSKIGRRVQIGVHSFIDSGCTIGDNVVIGKSVKILSGCRIPAGTVITDGTTLGKASTHITKNISEANA